MKAIQVKKYNLMIKRINKMPTKELKNLIKEGKCPFEPEHLVGVPMGMFHCELCGEMVIAGFKHK